VLSSGPRVYGLRFMVQVLEFRVCGLGLRA